MDCAECYRLSAECARLEQEDADLVKALVDSAETLSARDYIRLRQAALEARIDSEIARTEFEQHQRIHAKAN